ncbi:hypothetical protein T439DRAFT_162764 [Meredithblackwellia eburnea MCA 4105]
MGLLVTILAALGLIWFAVMWFLSLLGFSIARSKFGKPAPKPSAILATPRDQLPGVTVLRPLRGLDCNLYENLESTFNQDYPGPVEIIFSVADEADPAIPIVNDLLQKYPAADARLLIGEEIVGVNPKINNLIRAYRAAKFDILWVIDSNVLSSLSTLSNSVSIFATPTKPGQRPIGLVHHLPFAIYPDSSLGSRVEQAFLCTTHAKMYLAINFVAIASCVCGKSCLYRKTDLERAAMHRMTGDGLAKNKGKALAEGEGGLAAFGKYLGEDNMIGEALWEDLGMRHALTTDLAGNTVGSMSIFTFVGRRVRWIRVRKYMVIASTIIEPLTESLLCGLVGCLSLSHFFSLSPFLTFPVHLILWFILDCYIFDALNNASPSPNRHRTPRHDGPGGLDFVQAWVVRELLALPVWVFAMLGNEVGWRDNGQTYRVQSDGSVKLVPEGTKQGLADRLLTDVTRRMGDRSGYVVLRPDEENS